MRVIKLFPYFLRRLLRGLWMSSMAISREMIYIPLLVCLAGHCFRAGIPAEDTVRWTRAHYRLPDDEFLIRETVQNVYRTCKGFADKKQSAAGTTVCDANG